MSIIEIIAVPLGYILFCCLKLVQNYGWAILLFTLLTKVLLYPLTMWVHKNSIKMIRLQPQVNEIRAKHFGDSIGAMDLQRKLYKEEGYRPSAGMIPMLIQIPIIIGLINVIYNPLTHILHLDAALISAFIERSSLLAGQARLGSSAQLAVIHFIKDPLYTQQFIALSASGAAEAVGNILSLDIGFGLLDLSAQPAFLQAALWQNLVNLMPILSGASAFLLSFVQNKINILQRDAGWLSRWGMAIFLTLFSLYFASVVPAGVAFYWIASNVLAILLMLICYWIVPPQKHIDYAALEKSKEMLELSKAAAKELKPTKEQKAKAKADYKRFCAGSPQKKILFYSERSGFYKYYGSTIEEVLRQSDYDVHYLTSDPNDAIFKLENPRVIPYYIDDNRLILAFMKTDADVVVMTMPDIEQFHLKRSYIRKDIEYVYMYHAMVVGPRTVRKGATQHYDTLLCTGPKHVEMERKQEQFYGWVPRRIIDCGYPLLDKLTAAYAGMGKHSAEAPRILIAPSYQEHNILDACIHELLAALIPLGYDITIRPHPQYLKLYPGRMGEIQRRCEREGYQPERLHFQTDFSDNRSVYESDLIVTDWSSIAYEFAFTTKKPALFIDVPAKIINEDFAECEEAFVPELTLRNVVGRSVAPDRIKEEAAVTVQALFDERARYESVIANIIPQYISNLGFSAEIAARHIVDSADKRKKKEG